MKLQPYCDNPLQRPAESIFLLLFGGVGYYLLEMLWRGFSHWSMAVCGSICFLFCYRMEQKHFYRPWLFRALIGSLFITLTELVCGCILNLGLGWNVWNYSSLPHHFLGQICLPYSLLWAGLYLALIPVMRLIRRDLFLADA